MRWTTRPYRWLILAALSACTAEVDPPSTLESKLDAFPEFTLAQQEEAMKAEAERRKLAYVEGLRQQTPASEWITLAYHGLVLDANGDTIELDEATIATIQASTFDAIYDATREAAIEKYGNDIGKLFHEPTLDGVDQLVTRAAVLEGLIAVGKSALRERYEWRIRLLRGGVTAILEQLPYTLPARILALLQQHQLHDWVVELPSGWFYIQRCREQGVPIPPNWPDSRWISQGALALRLVPEITHPASFISTDLTAEVFAYKDPAVPGVCYALPRTSAEGSILLLGIICQSATTGKACFWDNRTRENAPLTGVDLTLEIGKIGDGGTLGERCTQCHRGANAFNIHPGTALDLSRTGAPGGPYTTSTAVRYTPMGQATWINPPALTTAQLPPPPAGQRSCTGCHEIPETRGGFCTSVLAQAARYTMPPHETSAGWPGSSGGVGASFLDHITRLSACP